MAATNTETSITAVAKDAFNTVVVVERLDGPPINPVAQMGCSITFDGVFDPPGLMQQLVDNGLYTQ